MEKNPKNLKNYLDESGLRFQINEEKVWGYIETTFGRKRAEELRQIFDETYMSGGRRIETNKSSETILIVFLFCFVQYT